MTDREKFRLYRKTRDLKLREELINSHRPLAEHIARQFVDSGEPLEDLVQASLIGLIKAVDGFDPDRGTEFTTFAWRHIRGEVSHYLRDQGKLISEPAWLQEVRIKVERARNDLRQKLKRDPTTEELIKHTQLKAQVVKRVLATESLFRVRSLDSTAAEENEELMADLEYLDLDSEEKAKDIEQSYFIRYAINKLPELQRKVVEALFWEDLTMTEVARQLGKSVTYVSYLLNRAIMNLRQILGISPQKGTKKRKKP